MSLLCSKREKFFFSDVQIRIMIGNEIYCYINGSLKWNISKKTSYIVGNTKILGKICILNLRNKIKSIFARELKVKKITKETVKIIIKSTYR